MRPFADLAFVGNVEVEHGEKRLRGFSVSPVRFGRRFVPNSAGTFEVVVLLVVVHAIVACIPHQFRVKAHEWWDRDLTTHVLSADAGGVHARNEGCSGRGADWCRGPAIRIAQTAGGEAVQMGCDGDGVSKAA